MRHAVRRRHGLLHEVVHGCKIMHLMKSLQGALRGGLHGGCHGTSHDIRHGTNCAPQGRTWGNCDGVPRSLGCMGSTTHAYEDQVGMLGVRRPRGSHGGPRVAI